MYHGRASSRLGKANRAGPGCRARPKRSRPLQQSATFTFPLASGTGDGENALETRRGAFGLNLGRADRSPGKEAKSGDRPGAALLPSAGRPGTRRSAPPRERPIRQRRFPQRPTRRWSPKRLQRLETTFGLALTRSYRSGRPPALGANAENGLRGFPENRVLCPSGLLVVLSGRAVGKTCQPGRSKRGLAFPSGVELL